MLLALILLGGCRSSGRRAGETPDAQPQPAKTAPPLPTPRVTQEPQPPTPAEQPPPPPEAKEPTRIVIEAPDRWYRAEEYEPSAQPESFQATFDRARNKIDVETHGVTQFTINTGRIPIDWERLVILGIDGRNSELRRRDFDVLRFKRDNYGQWVVVEP